LRACPARRGILTIRSDKRFCPEKWSVQDQEKEWNEILDVQGVANFLHCSKSHVSNILNGKVPNVPPIPHVPAGRKKLIRRAALVEWFKAQEAASLEVTPKC
jgi:hypothetical protein